jgi:hypothetical protein
MKNKTDKSLEEVWIMKDKVQKDFIKSKNNDFIDFVNNESETIQKKYNIKYQKDIQYNTVNN